MRTTYTILEKKAGETPLSALEAWRAEHPDMRDVPLSYAGRLDPMASGKLLVLIGDECKRQAHYRNLDKQYVFEILFGFSSDTGDVLGMAERDPQGDARHPEKNIRKAGRSFEGIMHFPFPDFSSKTVRGKPLFAWAREGKLHEIRIPIKTTRVYNLSLLRTSTISKATLREEIFKKIDSLPEPKDPENPWPDFRKADIRARWNTILDASPETHFQTARFSCIASSGTYMRTLAKEIAGALGTKGLAYSIHRTRIGKYIKIPFLPGFWMKIYA